LSARSIYTTSDAFKAQDPELMEKGFKGFCKEGMYGFFNAVTDRPYVIDKSRAWMGHFNFADWFDKEPKVLCMVRDLRSIFTSMEKNYRNNSNSLFVKAIRIIAQSRANEIAHIAGARSSGDILGKMVRIVGESACFVLGSIARPFTGEKFNRWLSMYSPKIR
jgi:hypothetical protein